MTESAEGPTNRAPNVVTPEEVALALSGIDAGAAKGAPFVGLVIETAGRATTLTDTLVDAAPKNVVPCLLYTSPSPRD